MIGGLKVALGTAGGLLLTEAIGQRLHRAGVLPEQFRNPIYGLGFLLLGGYLRKRGGGILGHLGTGMQVNGVVHGIADAMARFAPAGVNRELGDFNLWVY